MSSPASPPPLHAAHDIDRNLLRLTAYASLVLQDPPLPTPAGYLHDPYFCARHLLSASATLFARVEGLAVPAAGEPPVADHVAFLVALVSRVPFSGLSPVEGLARLRLDLGEVLRQERLSADTLDRFHPRLRRRLLDLVQHLRGDPRGERALGPCLDIAGRLYYLGDALGFFRLLTPPGARPPCRTSTRSLPTSRRPAIRIG